MDEHEPTWEPTSLPSPSGVPETDDDLTATTTARRRISRRLIAAVAITALIAGGAGVLLHRSIEDRDRALAQVHQSQADLSDQQATADAVHESLLRDRSSGHDLDASVGKLMDTMQQLNDLNKRAQALLATELQAGERGVSGWGAYNQAVNEANAIADQINALIDQVESEAGNLPTI